MTDLTRQDLAEAADVIGCDAASMKAVMEIEAAGKGFIDGKPTVLFEPHIFYRQLKKAGIDPHSAIDAGLASIKWDRSLYPRGSSEKRNAANWVKVESAMRLDQEAALKSASYGLGQVMGFNHGVAGYDTATAMVEAMAVSEGQQLLAMVNFIVNNRIDDEIREGRWADFARKYNGPAYAKNNYDVKLAAAHAKHLKDRELFWADRPNHGNAATIEHALEEGEVVAAEVDDDDEAWGWV